jgi:hypothetical protein
MVELRMEMYEDERPLEILLLRQIQSAGGSVHIYDHIDPRPYKRMQKKGWLTSQQVGRREAVYEITEAGRQAVSDAAAGR